MPSLNNSEARLWRTDLKRGRGIYGLVSNDVTKPGEFDPLLGVMESSVLAEHVVEIHNKLIEMYGAKHYRKVLGLDD